MLGVLIASFFTKFFVGTDAGYGSGIKRPEKTESLSKLFCNSVHLRILEACFALLGGGGVGE